MSIMAVKSKRSGKIHVCVSPDHNGFGMSLCGWAVDKNWKELEPHLEDIEISCKVCLSYIGFTLPKRFWITHFINIRNN